MRLARRVLFAVLFGLVAPILPVQVFAGGGGGPAGAGGLVLGVDHSGPAGHNWGYLDYFSRTVTVHPGQVITWNFAHSSEPHTVSLIPAGVPVSDAALSRVYPGGQFTPDKDDGAKAPPVANLNQAVQVGCGNSPYYRGTGPCSFTGHNKVNSGVENILPGQGAQTYSLRVDAPPGVYHYFCIVHGPSMSGTIRVVAPGAPADTQASVNQRAAAQYRSATTHALAFESHLAAGQKTAGGHTIWTVHSGAGYGRVAINEFIPRNLHTKPGDTVVWTPGFHTVTFPDESGVPPFSIECEAPGRDNPFRGALATCPGAELGLNPKGSFPSGKAGQAYTGGFYNSGNLVIPQPHPWSASFPKGGVFKYECLVHPGMDAVITTG
jgi:plastocyanin